MKDASLYGIKKKKKPLSNESTQVPLINRSVLFEAFF